MDIGTQCAQRQPIHNNAKLTYIQLDHRLLKEKLRIAYNKPTCIKGKTSEITILGLTISKKKKKQY